MQYVQRQENEWIQPKRKSYFIMCCDCGLVHELDFRIYKGHIQFRAKRNERKTATAKQKLAKERKGAVNP